LVVGVVPHAVVRVDRNIVAVVAIAAVARPAPEAGCKVVLAQGLAAGEIPAQVGVTPAVRVVVVPVAIVQRGIDGIAALQCVVRAAARARIEEGVAPVATAKRIGAHGVVDAILTDAGLRITEVRQHLVLVEGLPRGLVIDLDLRENILRHIVETQHRLELDLRFRVPPEQGVGTTQSEMRCREVRPRRDAAFEERLCLLTLLRAECGAGEQIAEVGIARAGALERRKQVVSLLVLALADQLAGARDIGIGRERGVRQQHNHRHDERLQGGPPPWAHIATAFGADLGHFDVSSDARTLFAVERH